MAAAESESDDNVESCWTSSNAFLLQLHPVQRRVAPYGRPVAGRLILQLGDVG